MITRKFYPDGLQERITFNADYQETIVECFQDGRIVHRRERTYDVQGRPTGYTDSDGYWWRRTYSPNVYSDYTGRIIKGRA